MRGAEVSGRVTVDACCVTMQRLRRGSCSYRAFLCEHCVPRRNAGFHRLKFAGHRVGVDLLQLTRRISKLVNVLLKRVAQITFAGAGGSRQLPHTRRKLRSLVLERHHLIVLAVEISSLFRCGGIVLEVGRQGPALVALRHQQQPRLGA